MEQNSGKTERSGNGGSMEDLRKESGWGGKAKLEIEALGCLNLGLIALRYTVGYGERAMCFGGDGERALATFQKGRLCHHSVAKSTQTISA